MTCNILVIAGLASFILVGIPILFYVYERCCNRSAHWCLHKTLMLFGALLICVGLGWRALRIITAVVCSL
jgi:hypothetical protein